MLYKEEARRMTRKENRRHTPLIILPLIYHTPHHRVNFHSLQEGRDQDYVKFRVYPTLDWSYGVDGRFIVWGLAQTTQMMDNSVSFEAHWANKIIISHVVSHKWGKPQHAASKLACLALSSARPCRSSICPGHLSTA